MNTNKIHRSVGTHDGSFHADEVTACGLLILFDLVDSKNVIRTRDPEVLARCEYVCDVGGVYDPAKKLFDHHQVEYQGSMSSAGMILKYLHDIGKLTNSAYQFFNQSLIAGVDAHDNGLDPQIPGVCTYSHVIANYVPYKQDVDSETQDSAFREALDFAFNHLQRMWDRYNYIQSCRETVAEAMRDKGECLMFEHSIPWLESFFDLGGDDHPARFVIMPSNKHWKLRGIPPSLANRMQVRHPLPEEWAGLHDDDLKKVSGIPGAIFCHKGKFISVWETKEDALKALEFVLNKGSR